MAGVAHHKNLRSETHQDNSNSPPKQKDNEQTVREMRDNLTISLLSSGLTILEILWAASEFMRSAVRTDNPRTNNARRDHLCPG